MSRALLFVPTNSKYSALFSTQLPANSSARSTISCFSAASSGVMSVPEK